MRIWGMYEYACGNVQADRCSATGDSPLCFLERWESRCEFSMLSQRTAVDIKCFFDRKPIDRKQELMRKEQIDRRIRLSASANLSVY